MDIRSNLESKLLKVAESNKISINGSSNIAICDDLMEIGVISYHNAKLIKSIIDIVDLADNSITDEQVDEIMTLYHGVKL